MNVRVRRGTTCTLTITVTQNGSPVNLTGKVLVFSTDAAANFHKRTNDVGSGFTITNAAQGVAQLVLTPAVTRTFTLAPGKTYEIEMWDGAIERNLLAGKFIVVDGINSDQS